MTEAELAERNIRAIIFDCDGTLADTMPPHFFSVVLDARPTWSGAKRRSILFARWLADA